MPLKYGKDSNFKGKKGRSGRYTKYNEETKNKVIKDSWTMTGQNLNPERALPIVLKDMVDKKEIDIPKNIIDLIRNVKPDINSDGDTSIPNENPN